MLQRLSGQMTGYLCRELVEKFGKHSLDGEGGESMTFAMTAYQAVQSRVSLEQSEKSVLLLTHLDRFGRPRAFSSCEVIAQAENPVMLYSCRKTARSCYILPVALILALRLFP